MAKMSKAAKTFDPFADTTPPRSDAADPGAAKMPVPTAAFRPASVPVPTPPADPADLSRIPDPSVAAGDAPELTAVERADLAACEAALDNLRRAFWGAGKALQAIRDRRLYKDGYSSFDAYLSERWGMTRQQATRLIQAWPLAERLSPIGDRINEGQVRELLPVAARHGQDAAAVVYEVVAEIRDGKVTAALLSEAVKAIPDVWDADVAAERIRACLSGGEPPAATPPPASAAGAEQFVTAVGRVWSALRQTVRKDVVAAAAVKNPGFVRKFAGDLRELADELEKEVGT